MNYIKGAAKSISLLIELMMLINCTFVGTLKNSEGANDEGHIWIYPFGSL